MAINAILKRISYTFLANLVSLGVSIFMVMIVPKFLSVEDYGLWQLFLFYYSYVGFLAFGLEDGIYLRFAGYDLQRLDSKLFAGQYYLNVSFQILFALILSSCAPYFVNDSVKLTALLCAIWISPLAHLYGMSSLILQMVNQIKKYAALLITEGVVFFFCVLLILLSGKYQFRYFYIAKYCSTAVMALMAVFFCRRLLIPRFYPLREVLYEAYENISVGIKLMLANIASILIIGIVRYGISMGWDVATFGKVSLTLGVSNFLMVFINSVSVVFFPIVKRMDEGKRSEIYAVIRNALTFLLFAGLIGYYPVRYILSLWLPKYADSLVYMSVLFPVCVFESKVTLLINTYLKSMRREFLMLEINAMSVVFSLIVTIFTVGIWHSLDATVFSIVLVYAFRCVLAEYHVTKLLGLDLRKNILEDLLMCGIFIISGWLFDSFLCMAVYGAAYLVFMLVHRRSLQRIIGMVRV